MELTKSQKIFADDYLTSNNMTKSYRLGFPNCKSDTSAAAAASRLLRTNKAVRDYIDTLEVQVTKQAMSKAAISKERILQEESAIAFADPKDLLDENGALKDLKDLPEVVRRGIKKITESTFNGIKTVRIEFYDKGKSLDRLEKCLKMQQDGIDLAGGLTLRYIIESIDGKNRGRLPQES